MTSAASASARRSASQAENASRDAASDVADSKWGDRALRFGIGARGFVFLVVAYLVARIAGGALGGSTNDSASGPGAAQAIQKQTGGDVALFLLGVGMLLFALFCVVDAVRNKGDSDDSEAKVWAKRGLSLWRGALYAAFGIFCFVKVFAGSSGGSSGHSNRRQSQWSAEVLRWPAGWFWLGALGVVLFVAAGIQVYRAVTRKFRKHLEEYRMSSRVRSIGTGLGVAGYVGRGGAYALVGWFVLHAAIENDPDKGKGVDGSARMLANSSGGPALLWILAALIFAFGLYLFVEARYRKI